MTNWFGKCSKILRTVETNLKKPSKWNSRLGSTGTRNKNQLLNRISRRSTPTGSWNECFDWLIAKTGFKLFQHLRLLGMFHFQLTWVGEQKRKRFDPCACFTVKQELFILYLFLPLFCVVPETQRNTCLGISSYSVRSDLRQLSPDAETSVRFLDTSIGNFDEKVQTRGSIIFFFPAITLMTHDANTNNILPNQWRKHKEYFAKPMNCLSYLI